MMTELRAASGTFSDLARELVAQGLDFRFQARGRSMWPEIKDGETLRVRAASEPELKVGDIVLFTDGAQLKAHRIIHRERNVFITRGDSGLDADGIVREEQIVGKIMSKECAETGRELSLSGWNARLRFRARETRRRLSQVLTDIPFLSFKQNLILLFLLLLLTPLALHAQVAVDNTANSNATLIVGTPGLSTISFAHTVTPGGVNRVLVVGVSINVAGNSGSSVTAISYNGAALTKSFAFDPGNNFRVEMWYLVNPATGSNTVQLTVNKNTGNKMGVVVGAIDFTNADQTSPIRGSATASGNNDTISISVPSAVNDVVLDTISVVGNDNVTAFGTNQTSQWTNRSGTTGQDDRGAGSTRAGAPSVPMTENLSAANNWSDGAVSIRPPDADLAVSVSGSTSLFPANVTYTVAVTNNGPDTGTGVTLTDTLASGLTLVSAVPSQGSCSGTTTITCTLNSINSGSNATILITATPSTAGGYVNSATVSSSSPDLEPANNTGTAVAYSELAACAPTTSTPGGTLTGVINTYYPGTATVTAGSTSITLGTATGASTAISANDLVLIVQMQDAAINSTNTSSYGDGISGTGSTNLNNAGLYEFATATNSVALSGGTLTLSAAGSGGGLLYTYTSAAATSTQGTRSFQVVRVPNFSTATLGSGLTASAWNGSTGGILSVNVSGTLTLGSATVSVDGLGFRGAAGLQLNGIAGATNTDFRFNAPSAYSGAAVAGADGSKGEGVAGTPHWVKSGSGFLNTGAEGYPNGSMALGAPGNAGGGGTDGAPATNSQNSGGGGGAHGGTGGQGGNSKTSDLSVGGFGGTAFPGSISRLSLGGGGGAGTRDNSTGDALASSGGAGGGIVIIRAGALAGTATISANGAAAYNATSTDGGGGGGAGGSIMVLSGGGGEIGLTLAAHGGTGGNASASNTANREGPGGGGGGGAVLLSGAATGIDVSGGANGTTLSSAYGSTSGSAGFSATNLTLSSSPGPHSASICTDMAITKIGTPEPVLQNATLTYTLTVTNLGPQTATGVVVVDTLPTQVSYVSSSSTGIGVCTQAAGVVTCNFATMISGDVETITIITTAVTPSLALNTAAVNSTTPDPVLSNNTATFTSTIEFPNAVRLNSFTAVQNGGGVLLSWKSGGELHNLGYNVYRDLGGAKVQVNPSLIAGSALSMREVMEQHAAKTYGWLDRSPANGGMYWLEDVDLNGTRTMHGPVTVESGPAAPQPFARVASAITMRDLAQANSALGRATTAESHIRETTSTPRSSESTRNTGFQLAAHPAVKIFVDHEGWYHVTQPQLVAAGLPANVEARSLHLFAEGVEQPIRITGAASGFGSQSAIEFYGTAIDTPYSGQRVYWLMSSGQPGLRVASPPAAGSPGPQAQSFLQTLELKPRTTYFAVLLTGNSDNFFGPLVSPVAAVQTLNISNLAAGGGSIQLVLQGVTLGQQHDVTVAVNDATLGDVTFTGQQQGKAQFPIPAGVLVNGPNSITLTAQQGDNDLSLVDHIDLSFPHTFTAESDTLKFTAPAGDGVTINGFVQPPTRLVDITNPAQQFQVAYQVTLQNGGYALQTTVPWTSPGRHTLLALSDALLAAPVTLAPHQPSTLHQVQAGADTVIVTAPQFTSQVQPLATLHRGEGRSVALVSVDQVYDEFNFGERTPFAIRDFLQTATTAWKNKPHYLLLGGDASVDPRDYFGLGSFDFVPTKIVPTSELMTASDDWFSDFSNSGFAQIATGRLPARSTADAHTMVSKILSYANGQTGSWTNQSMLVADTDDPSTSFSQAALAVQKFLPQTMNVNDVFVGTLGIGTAHQNILAGINSGQLLVNYNGHGSVQIWGSNLFDDTNAAALTNGNRLPVFVMMNCLNGFFHDVFTQSLAEALLLSPNGGAVAVWASSGLTAPGPQFQMDQTLVKTLFAQPSITVGDAVLFAKSGIADPDVRKTFILFGDPLMRLKSAQGLAPVRIQRPGFATETRH
jgi:uncharacterized repeat protein (TIGR01451 family)